MEGFLLGLLTLVWFLLFVCVYNYNKEKYELAEIQRKLEKVNEWNDNLALRDDLLTAIVQVKIMKSRR